MDVQLTELEDKVRRLRQLVIQLRAENLDLRQSLATQRQQVKQLSEKLDGARDRVGQIIAQLPES
jgi:uncharacterized protein (TIGR02449 family)